MLNKTLKLCLAVLLGSLLLAGCNQKPGASAKNPASAEKPIPVMVENIELADLEEYISFTARVEGITDIILTSESSGKVTELKKKLGDWVETGEAIASLENESLQHQLEQAKASLLAAEASFELAALQKETTEKLFAEKLLAQSDYIAAQSSYKQALATRENASALLKQQELAVKNSRFTSPVSGYISDLKLEIGSFIASGQPVCRIVDHSRLLIKTGLGEADVTGIKVGQKALISSNFISSTLTGKISGIGIAPVTGSVNYPLEIELDNPDLALLPGMVVSGKILKNTYRQVLYTSINNLTQIYDDHFIYSITDQNRARQNKVKLGRQIERFVIIESGIEPGDLIVIEGASSLNDNSLVQVKN